jgi:hypothetical protein
MKIRHLHLFSSLMLSLLFVLKLNAHQITFTENKGQVIDQFDRPREDVLFSGQTDGMIYHLRKNGVSYQLLRIDSWKKNGDTGSAAEKSQAQLPDQITHYRTDMNWIGINSDYTIKRKKVISGYNNYYLPGCPEGITNVQSFESITYENIYQGIDLHWYENKGELKYDFVIEAGVDYTQIRWNVTGALAIFVNALHELVIETPLGTIQEQAPVALQGAEKIEANWTVSGNVVSFVLGKYNTSLPLIIDPVIRHWGTYYGGGSSDQSKSSASDAADNIYFAGLTNSTLSTFASAGAHQVSRGGYEDAFLVKLDSNGVRQWATYYGGALSDQALACAVGPSGDIYMTGITESTSVIATSGTHQDTLGGKKDAFVVRFNSSGIRQWGTYFGGGEDEEGYDCHVDAVGNLYLSGTTESITNIANAGSHQTTMNGLNDAFLVQFNTNGIRQWATYYGGTSYDNGYGCTTDPSNNVYLVGETRSNASISTFGSHQSSIGIFEDAFVVKFNNNGVRQWATYYGANGAERFYACTVDGLSNVYAAGQTSSTVAVATTGAHQTAFGGFNDGLLVKFDSSGVRQWGTYYGGTAQDGAYGCAVDGIGVYLAGFTASTTTISTAGGYQSTSGGGNDAFLAKFDDLGNLLWGTYYGGSGTEWGYDCAIDGAGKCYLTGSTSSITGIATPGSHKTGPSGIGVSDAFMVRFAICNPDKDTSSVVVCDSLISPSGKHIWKSSGTYYDTLTNGVGCDSLLTINLTINTTPSIIFTQPDSTCDVGIMTLTATPSSGNIDWFAASTGGVSLSFGNNFLTPSLSSTTTYFAEGVENGCKSVRSPVIAIVNTSPFVTSTAPNSRCDSGTVTLSAIAGGGALNWYTTAIGGTSIATGASFSTPVITTTTSYFVEATEKSCTSSRSKVDATVLYSSVSSIHDTACNIYLSPSGSFIYFLSGVYNDTIPNFEGCDSVITLNITINHADTSVSRSGSILTANASPALYQWIDCTNHNLPISGATGQDFIPEVNGNYAVIITQNNCIDTSSCYSINAVTVPEKTRFENILVYPNPTSDLLNIDLGEHHSSLKLNVKNATGQLILERTIRNERKVVLDLSLLSKGVYSLTLLDENGRWSYRLVKN